MEKTPSTDFPSGVHSAMSLLLEEYKKFQSERDDWLYEKEELLAHVQRLSKQYKSSKQNLLVLSKAIQILKHALLDAKNVSLEPQIQTEGIPLFKEKSSFLVQNALNEDVDSVLKDIVSPKKNAIESSIVGPNASDFDVSALKKEEETPEKPKSSTKNVTFQEETQDQESEDDEDAENEAKMATIVKKGSQAWGELGAMKSRKKTKSKKKGILAWEEAEEPDEETAGGPKKWKQRTALRSHLDAVRSISFIESGSEKISLISGSEDGTLTLWDDVDKGYSMHTFMGHLGMVTKLEVVPSHKYIFSSGSDMNLYQWELPDVTPDSIPYAPIGKSTKYRLNNIKVHSDIVWDMAYTILDDARLMLYTAGADGKVIATTVDSNGYSMAKEFVAENSPTPTCLTPIGTSLVVGYTNGNIAVWDVETGACTRTFTVSEEMLLDVIDGDGVTIAGGHDKKLYFLDINSGKTISSMLAHPDSITSISLSPSKTTLTSACHGCSIRFWDMSTKKCVEDLSSHQTHRKKFDEGIHEITYHPSQDIISSAGADGVVKIYQQY